jgi:glycosyltransferase involved in cell wall biosynthesis
MKVFFSVIIPALNEEHFLPRLLRSLQKQQFTNFEVILVDSESKDKTISEAKKFGKYFPLTILTNTKRNVSRSRNMGAEKANGEYIFFIDADNSINSNFSSNI